MTDRVSDRRSKVGRRGFLTKALTVGMCTIAGCGTTHSRLRETERPSDDFTSTRLGEDSSGDDLEGIRDALDSLYRRLSALPIIEDDEFVFRMKAFESGFDQQQLFKDADEILRELKRQKSSDRECRTIESLTSSTEVAKLLARQRGIVHQVIAAGLVYHRRIKQGDYEGAADAIENANGFVVTLRRNIDRVAAKVEGSDLTRISIGTFDLDSIKKSQEHLTEVCRWTKPAYEGLYEIVRGIQRFEAGNKRLESEDYSDASSAYDESHTHFESAVESFDEAQGRGEQLPHLVPVVVGTRCLLPAYVESSRNLSKSMDEFGADNPERASIIAREALVNAGKKASRCYRSYTAPVTRRPD